MIEKMHLHDTGSLPDLNRQVGRFLSKYPNGVTVTIEPFYQQRTLKQNGTYQLMVRRLAEQSGLSTDEVKRRAKENAVGWGYPVERDDEGEPILYHGEVRGIPSKDANVAQFKLLIDALQQEALENRIILEDYKG